MRRYSMLYHFCIFLILSPFANLPEASCGNVRPREICSQAAQNILALAAPHHPGLGSRESLGVTPRFISEAISYMISKDRMTVDVSNFAELPPKIQNLGFQIDAMRTPTQDLLPQPPQGAPSSSDDCTLACSIPLHPSPCGGSNSARIT